MKYIEKQKASGQYQYCNANNINNKLTNNSFSIAFAMFHYQIFGIVPGQHFEFTLLKTTIK